LNVPLAPGAKGDMSFHVLRHWFASMLLETGVQGRVASQMLGHSSYTLTANLYQHPTDASQQQAAQGVGDWLLKAASGGAVSS
jgi:site-specific recombinase XerD